MSTETTSPVCEQSPSAFLDNLTGFDEIAIKKTFNASVDQLDRIALVRALAFVHKRREGAKDGEAYKAAMSMPQGELRTYFADEDEDTLDEDAEGNAEQPEQMPAP